MVFHLCLTTVRRRIHGLGQMLFVGQLTINVHNLAVGSLGRVDRETLLGHLRRTRRHDGTCRAANNGGVLKPSDWYSLGTEHSCRTEFTWIEYPRQSSTWLDGTIDRRLNVVEDA